MVPGTIAAFLLPSLDGTQGHQTDQVLTRAGQVRLCRHEDLLAEAGSVASTTLFVAYAQRISREDVAYLEQLRSMTDASVVLRTADLDGLDMLDWCKAKRFSFVPTDLVGPSTLENCVRAARAELVLPELKSSRDNALARYLRELAEDITASKGRVTLGVVSLPRSGSKYIADQLVMWAAPYARVFHTHSLTVSRSDEVAQNPSKVEKIDRSRAHINMAARLVLFVCERNPIDRILSEFALKYQGKIAIHARSGKGWDAVHRRLEETAAIEVAKISDWHHAQFFDRFGIDVSDLRPLSQKGYAIVRGQGADVVALQTERMRDLFASAGLDSPLVSTNSAIDRGYGDLYAHFRREARLSEPTCSALRAASIY